MLRINSPE